MTCGGAEGGDGGGPLGVSDGSHAFTAELNVASGNAKFTVEDPVVTRSTPLRNILTLQNQTSELTGPFGAAAFTYGMHVLTRTQSGGPKPSRWYVIDGDGEGIDFGTDIAPSAQPGVYSELIQVTGGYELRNAGPIGLARERGDYLYSFNTNGALVSIVDPAGNQQTVQYNGSGQIQSVTDVATGRALTFTWTGARVTHVAENGGPRTTLTYATVAGNSLISSIKLESAAAVVAKRLDLSYYASNAALLYSVTKDSDPDSTLRFSYVTRGNVSLANVWGNRTRYFPRYFLPPTAGVSGSVGRTELPNAKGGLVAYDLNSNTDIIRTHYGTPSGAGAPLVMTYGMNSSRQRTSISDGATTVTVSYDGNGMPLTVTRPDSTQRTFTWSGAKLLSVSDDIGTVQTVQYADLAHPNLPSSVTDAAGNVTTFTRNTYGQILTETPPSGSPIGVTTYTYEETVPTFLGLLKAITDPLGNETRFSNFTLQGDPQELSVDPDPSTSATREVTTASYDAARRRISTVHPDGKSILNGYTGRNLSSTTDEAGTVTSFGYCAGCGKLQSIARPLGHSLSVQLDDDRDITDYVDARSNATEYSYGVLRELTSVLYPDLSLESFSYDSSARLSSVTNARSQTTSLSYDSVGRLSGRTYPGVTESITYRADDQPLTVADATGSSTYEYYSNRLLKAEIYDYSARGLAALQRVEYEYWPDDSLKLVRWKNGATIVGEWSYSYDAAGSLTGVTAYGQSASFSRDGLGLMLVQTNPNGTATHYQYNYRGWPTAIQHKVGSTTFESFGLAYDGGANTVGNLTLSAELNGDTVAYNYNTLYRLTGETLTPFGSTPQSIAYNYDLAGNLTDVNSAPFATYDAANKISSLTSGSIAHDADGNVTSFTAPSITTTLSMTWNAQSKLTSIGDGTTSVDYRYGADGLRRYSEDSTGAKTFYI